MQGCARSLVTAFISIPQSVLLPPWTTINKAAPPIAGPSSVPNTSSTPPPPPFHDVAESTHLLIDFDNELPQDDPPPEFAPYHAEYFDTGNGNIVSHDPHLNSDGEALYRFLLSQASTPPSLSLHCRGTHSETRQRHVTHTGHGGRVETRFESYTETVVDFDFYISLDQLILPEPTHWSVADSDPAYRGRMFREIDLSGPRKARWKERRAFRSWIKDRDARGLPPWISNIQTTDTCPTLEDSVVLRSSKTLRAWADEYCASPKYLKEFVYVKSIYGWNLRNLESAIRSIIKTSFYTGTLEVNFETSGKQVYIRPDNRLSRTLSNKWLKFLSIILFIFPFIWLFKRFHSKGGGRWEVCGGAYALKRWQSLESEPEHHVDTKGSVARDAVIVRSRDGQAKKLVGSREGEWLKQWQGTIMRAVQMRYESTEPITVTTEQNLNQPLPVELDGY
ncbi:uncharacterized protein EV420DRAFT_1637223 [Desarmillaria tabescens]|uniref:Uncharacterized protein n=1 Tax=Armillaria tabescens TaxID=1929756 RepID=A0AA39NG74_ARMTA|nr:uncharacterized protein EV420DRAFT_1637223 [Desarmillaria tabescens]KAK0465054.1 hypothetical protein EV420DRAFT_1637223 [Desarmillaria tabescens]